MELNYTEIYNIAFKEIIETIEDSQYDSAAKVSIIAEFLLDLIQESTLTLSKAEEVFREIQSDVRLIGVPLYVFNERLTNTLINNGINLNLPRKKYTAFLPKSDRFYDYGLWILIEENEIERLLLNKFNITINETDQSLGETGFLRLIE